MNIDKIYCITLQKSKDRQKNIIDNLTKVGFIDKLEFYYAQQIPVSLKHYFEYYTSNVVNNKKIYLWDSELLPKYNFEPFVLKNLNSLSCTFSHYNIIKQAYNYYDNIMILEDDFQFSQNVQLVRNTFDLVPDNYSFFKFSLEYSAEYVNKSLTKYFKSLNISNNTKQEILSVNIKDCSELSVSSAGYCLSKAGMKKFIELYDNNLMVSDTIFKLFNENILIPKIDIRDYSMYFPSTIN